MRAFVRGTLVVAWQKVVAIVARDRVAQLFVFALPLGTTLVVGAATASGSQVHLVGVLPEDPALATVVQEVVEPISALRVDWVSDRSEADTLVARQEVAGSLEFIDDGDRTTVELRVDQGRVDPGLVSGPVLAVASGVSRRTEPARLAESLFGVTSADPSLGVERPAPVPRHVAPDVVVIDTGAPRPFGGFTFAAVGNLVLYSFVATFGTAVALLNERNEGQLERLMAAPVPRSALVSGHLLARLCIGAVQIAFVVVVTGVLFGAQWGSLWLLALLSFPFVLASGCLGLIAATLYRSNEQASIVTGLIAFPAAMLAGCFWPLAAVSEPLRIVGHALPQAWLVDGLLEVSAGAGLRDVAGELAVLMIVAAAVLPLSLWSVSRFMLSTPERTTT